MSHDYDRRTAAIPPPSKEEVSAFEKALKAVRQAAVEAQRATNPEGLIADLGEFSWQVDQLWRKAPRPVRAYLMNVKDSGVSNATRAINKATDAIDRLQHDSPPDDPEGYASSVVKEVPRVMAFFDQVLAHLQSVATG